MFFLPVGLLVGLIAEVALREAKFNVPFEEWRNWEASHLHRLETQR